MSELLPTEAMFLKSKPLGIYYQFVVFDFAERL